MCHLVLNVFNDHDTVKMVPHIARCYLYLFLINLRCEIFCMYPTRVFMLCGCIVFVGLALTSRRM